MAGERGGLKEFDGPARSVDSQFQIGDEVIYLPEGVRTRVEGYFWDQSLGGVPRVRGYQLACGVTVPENTIVKGNAKSAYTDMLAALQAVIADLTAALQAVTSDAWESEREPTYTVGSAAIDQARTALAKATGSAS